MDKPCFEKWLWYQAVAEVSYYHGNNVIFTTAYYRHDCNEKEKNKSFSGVGAHHQNARAECDIQTIMYMARTFMVYASLH